MKDGGMVWSGLSRIVVNELLRADRRCASTSGITLMRSLDELRALHYDRVGFEFSFGRALKKLINFFLNLLTDLLLSTFLASRAGDILDFKELSLHCRSGRISPRAALWAFPGHSVQCPSLGIVAVDHTKTPLPRLHAGFD
jgi:hypothetical protein